MFFLTSWLPPSSLTPHSFEFHTIGLCPLVFSIGVDSLHALAPLPLRHLWPLRTNKQTALAGVAQWIECWPVNQRVSGLIPSEGTCLGCRFGPWWGACER